MTLKIRRVVLEGLLETGVIEPVEIESDDGAYTTFMTNPTFFGEEVELSIENLLSYCEVLAAQQDVVFSFTFKPSEQHPWVGGISAWRKPLPIPKTQEEMDAFNAKNIPVYKIEGPWLPVQPDIVIDDVDIANMLCQLMTAMLEQFSDVERGLVDE